MSNPNLIINDSEGESDDESDGGIIDEPLQDQPLQPLVAPPILPESTNPESTAEIRRKEIDEAHAALLSTGTAASLTPIDPPPDGPKAKRAQTTNGRLEKDVYSFNASEEDEDIHSNKRKRLLPNEKSKATLSQDQFNVYTIDYDDGKKKPKNGKKKPAKRAKSAGGVPIIDLLNDSGEEDDWQPKAKAPTSGRGSTRSNTHEMDLLPPLPKPKRKPKELPKIATAVTMKHEFDGNLTLNFNQSADTQVIGAGRPATPTPHNFMVDLSKDHLILPEELRAEYDPVPLGSLPTEQLEDSLGNGDYDESELLSTIPDPPYDPSLLPSQIGPRQSDPLDTAPTAAIAGCSDSALSSLPNSPHQKSPTKKMRKDKKRAATDQNLDYTVDNGFGAFPIASEWRAAKGRARQGMSQAKPRRKTMNDLNVDSDEDGTWAGNAKSTKKKKPASRKRKTAAIVEDGAIEVRKQKAKRSGSKSIETLMISDSEDELMAPPVITPSAIIQASGMNSLEDEATSKMNAQVNTAINSGDELLGSIAVSNSPPSVGPSEDQPVSKPKKVYKWQMLNKRAVISDDESGTLPTPIMNMDNNPLPPQSLPSAPPPGVAGSEEGPDHKKSTPAQRRKSRKEDSDNEEDWDGDPQPKKRQKKEAKPRAHRINKKTALAKEKTQLSNMIKGSDDGGECAADEPAPEESVGKAPAKKEPKLSSAAAPKAKREKDKKEEAEAEAKETAEENGKTKATTPPPPPPPPSKLESQSQTPTKKQDDKGKPRTSHSPINKGPVKFRVGLSRRAHIEPLLKIIRK